ncbi:MAG TPA: hypothetical protein VN663_22870 [Ramlibacter sp.]|nr:hypothetical protein [Ramlibacter sp.]
MSKLSRASRGSGRLTVEQQEKALELLKDGMKQQAVAARFGVSKNVVAGIWSRFGEPESYRPPSTVFERMDALHAAMDAVLAETMGVGRVPNTPRP